MATSISPSVNPHFPTSLHGASSGAELFTLDGKTLPLVASTLRAVARGGLARLVLEQEFRNSYDETLAVTYRMPLPADGAVSGYAFEIAGRVITGVVDRKRAARERFEQAIASGRTAALLEQERADIFTQQIGNIPAGETIVCRITIDQRLVWLPEGEWELRFPTVIGPRYCGSAETISATPDESGRAASPEAMRRSIDARATHVKVATADTGVRLQIELEIGDATTRTPSSPSHQLSPLASGAVALTTGTRLDRDLVVRWPVATPEVGASLTARGGFGLLTLVPPGKAYKPAAVARDLLVLLDTSGSMGGGPLEKAKQVVSMLIDSLGERDRLELIEFSNEPRRYKAEPEIATEKAKAAAIEWVRSRQADGGTEMRAAVVEALQSLRIGAQRQVVVVTDGYVGGEQQILRALHDKLPASCRLHVLGVGAAVNRSLATALARAGRGAEVIVGVDEDAERGAKRLFDRTRMPVLTNVEIWGSALVRVAPEHLPDVFEGAPLVAALELKPEGGTLTVRGRLAHEAWEQTIEVPAQRAEEAGAGELAALFGRERVADLEARAQLESVDAEIEALGLRFQIATRLTSWVAVDERVRVEQGAKTRHELQPQELPYGTRAAAFGLRGSTPSLMRTRTQAGVLRSVQLDDADEMADGAFDLEASAAPPASYAYAPPPPAMAQPKPMAPASPTGAASGAVGGGAPRGRQEARDTKQEDSARRSRTTGAMPSVDKPAAGEPKKAGPDRAMIALVAALIAALIAALAWWATR